MYTVLNIFVSVIFLQLIPYRPVIRDTVSHTNLVVMVDDPVLSSNLGELLLQVQSGLTMGSRNSGTSVPEGSLLISSNYTVTSRYILLHFVLIL